MTTKREPAPSTRQQRLILRASLVFMTVIGMMFVLFFPLRTIVAQRREAAVISSDLAVLRSENGRLQSAAERLNTDAEIERLARARFHLVRPGETAYVAVEAPPGTPPVSYAPTTTTTRPVPPPTQATTATTKPGTPTTKKPTTSTTKKPTTPTTKKP